MLRTSRSKTQGMHLRWSSTSGRSGRQLEDGGEEGLPSRRGGFRLPWLLRWQHRPTSSRILFLVMVAACMVGCVLLCKVSGSIFLGLYTGSGHRNASQRVVDRLGSFATDRVGLDDVLPSSPGKPIHASLISNPPRFERNKLFSQLAKLSPYFSDADDDGVGEGIQRAYAASHWPPIISRIPPPSKHHRQEEPSVQTSDTLFCAASPCRVLLPVWARALSPGKQAAQVRGLVRLAARLDRTLVLPNSGPADSDGKNRNGNPEKRMLLGVGTCERRPFARYFDVSALLGTGVGTGAGATERRGKRKGAVPMQPFLEWVKYRPVRPSAQMVVLDAAANNSSDEDDAHSFLCRVSSAELRVDEQAPKGRGRRNGCLAAKAPKLDFRRHPVFVAPARRAAVDVFGSTDLDAASLRDLSGVDNSSSPGPRLETDDKPESLAVSYFDGILALLGGKEGTWANSTCPPFASGNEFTGPADIYGSDVLVVEWDLDSGSPLSPLELGEEVLAYSPRLRALAARLAATLQRPLVMLRLDSSASASTFKHTVSTSLGDDPERLSCFEGVVEEVDAFVQDFVNNSIAGDSIVKNKDEDEDGANANANVSLADSGEDPAVNLKVTKSTRKMSLGTLWLDQNVALELELERTSQARASAFASPSPSPDLVLASLSGYAGEDFSRSDRVLLARPDPTSVLASVSTSTPPITTPAPPAPSTLDTMLSRLTFQGLLVTNLSAALSYQGPSLSLSPGDHPKGGTLAEAVGDPLLRAILEKIVEGLADRVVILGC